jgi:tetratricopeptide (TPR) repeat protein
VTDDIRARFQEFLAREGQQEENTLAEMVEITLSRLGVDVAAGARHCAIPRWFDKDLIAALTQETTAQAEILLIALRELPYVRDLYSLGYAYRPEVRDYLISRLRAEDEHQYTELHRRAHDYFDEKLKLQGFSLGEAIWTGLTEQQTIYLREKLYHLLTIEPNNGLELLDQIFRVAHRFHLFGEAATLVAFGQEHIDEISVLNHLRLRYYEAVLAHAYGRWKEALESLQDILINKELPPEFRAQILSQLGTIYVSVSKLDQAIDVFSQSKQVWDNLKDTRRSAALANNLGNAYLAKGDLYRAEKSFTEGLTGLTKVGDHAEQAAAYNNLGNVRAQKEDWKKAIEFYKKSLEIKQQNGDSFGVATTQTNLGTVLQRMSQNAYDSRREAEQRSQAIDYYSSSVSLFRRLNTRPNLAISSYKLAMAYDQAGQTDLARQHAQVAFEILDALNLPERDMAGKLVERLRAASAS